MRSMIELVQEYNQQAEHRRRNSVPEFLPPILVSRQPGSGGLLVAQEIASQLGFQLWDKNLLEHAASQGHISAPYAERFDENPQSILHTVGMHLITFSGAPTPEEFAAHVKRSIKSLLHTGAVVIVGRGAPYLATPGKALRVRIVATEEKRIANWMERFHLTEQAARRELHDIDHHREIFLKRVYGKTESDATCFDLGLNSGVLSLDSCVNIVLKTYEELTAVPVSQLRGRSAGTVQSNATAQSI